MTTKPKAPETLAAAGTTLWKRIVKDYDLRPDELRTLEDACAAADMVAALSSVWEDEGRPVTTKGSMGQQVIHPLIGEIRTQRASLNALFRQLKLPDLDASGAVETNPARAAAATRWKHGA